MYALLTDVLQFAHYALTFILIVVAAVCAPAAILVIIAIFPRKPRGSQEHRWR